MTAKVQATLMAFNPVFKKITRLFGSENERVKRDLLRLARTEYPKDWEYAYAKLLQGQMPYEELKNEKIIK